MKLTQNEESHASIERYREKYPFRVSTLIETDYYYF